MNKLLFISFYTEGYYEKIKDKYLLPSLEKFELSYKIYPFLNSHDWLKNGKYKTQIILDTLKSTQDDIVYLDVDAQIIKTPELFNRIPENCNLGVHVLDWYKFWHNKEGLPKREVIGGTLYFRNNSETIKFVEEWNRLNQESLEWGQRILQKLLPKIQYYTLPFEYCRILKLGEEIPDNAIIVQHQASRQGKKKL